MAELYPTPTRLALLRDIRDGKVFDDADAAPMLDIGEGEVARVAATVWEMGRAGWCQPTGAAAWELTDAGRAVLAADEPQAVIDPGEGLLT